MTTEHRYSVQHIAALIVLFVGIALVIASFCVPPTGEIHHSVLTALGEVLTFVGSVWGIETTAKRKIYEIDKKNGKNVE